MGSNSEWIKLGRYLVNVYRIAGTRTMVAQVWEPLEGGPFSASHSTITCHEGRWLGRVGTRRGGDHEAIPVGAARFKAVRRHYAEQAEEGERVLRESGVVPRGAELHNAEACWQEGR